MPGLEDILQTWRNQKVERHFYRLSVAFAVFYEFQGPQWGHSSNYASVQIAAEPADDLAVDFLADLPAALDSDYRGKLARAVEIAAIDELFASEWHPHRGCRLVFQKVGWDDVMGSEVAIYKAARGALTKLRQEGTWDLVAKR